jgi:class 3 adenylate cyclase/tetratricopeptide (TPR) repeat protein
MKCSKCGHENRGSAKFCEECGGPLPRQCPYCDSPVSTTAKFCPECAHSLELTSTFPAAGRFGTGGGAHAFAPKHLVERVRTSKHALEGERKQVTVLFADLKGSMELLADRDPEETMKLVDPVLAHMMEAVHRYEGTVNQVMGDGIMALFGAPIAHEDHAVRACYAALRMQERVKRYAEVVRRTHAAVVKIRVGLNSGDVVVRAIGSDLHMDYTAIGPTTHLAARMEQIADPGAIMMPHGTLALVEGYVEVKPLGPVAIKGLADAVDVYELAGAGPVRTRLQAAVRRGLTRFVGREAEVQQLHRVQELAGGGRGQVAALVGDAGVGKSRLVYELSHSHRMRGWLVLESTSVSYGKATSYLPVIDLLKAYFKIQDSNDVREIREKVTGKLLTLDRSLESMLPPLLSLLDVPVDDAKWVAIDARQRRQHTLDAVRLLLLCEAREQPVLLIFEDLHWIDSETQALLDSLVGSLGSARVLLVVNYRPGYQHGWSGKSYYTQLRLDALAEESTGELLDALLGDNLGLAPLKQLLVKRGNPFFLEETIRTLVETHVLVGQQGCYRLTQAVQAIQIPPTVQTMLVARIDRLAPDDKHLLQTASVVGKDVPWALLQAIAALPDELLRERLDRLQAAEFVYETKIFPELEYSFKHALTHEVTYGGLLQERKRELHARIVHALEGSQRGHLEAEVERLAHHAVRGGLPEKAVHYLRLAGRKATARSAFKDAVIHFDQALDLLAALPESRAMLEQSFDIRLELRPALNSQGEVTLALQRTREAANIAEMMDDDSRRGRASGFIANSHTMLGELGDAVASGAKALAIAERLGDLRLRIPTTTHLAQAHYWRNEHEQVIELARANIAAVPAESNLDYFGLAQPPSVWDRSLLAMSLAHRGNFAEASEYSDEAVRLAESTHNGPTIGMALRGAVTLRIVRKSWHEARSVADRFVETAAGIHQPYAVACRAWVLAQLGEANASMECISEGERLLKHQAANGIVAGHEWAYAALGHACLVLGRLDEAQRLGRRSVKSALSFNAHGLDLLGQVAFHPDRLDPEVAERLFREVLTLATPRGLRPLIASAHLGLGTLFRLTGKFAEARKELDAATLLYREMDMQIGER